MTPGRTAARVVALRRRVARVRSVDVSMVAALLLWSVPAVPWWWRRDPVTYAAGGYLLAVLQSLPFYWRRRYPAVVLAWSAVLLLPERRQDDGGQVYVAVVAFLLAAYGLGAYGGAWRRRVARVLAALLLGVALVLAAFGASGRLRVDALAVAVAGAAFLAGDAHGSHREAARITADAAALRERTRIARELHDVLTHQLSAIAVQAGAARLATQVPTGPGEPPPDPPDPARQALTNVEHLARDALVELNQLLGALRSEPQERLARRPAPGLAELEALLDGFRAGRLPVTCTTIGTPQHLPAGMQLAAYRIVQEALTNVTRHAAGAVTHVQLRHEPGRLHIEVVNAAPPHTRPVRPFRGRTGRGLQGMRERAAAYSGRLHAGKLSDGGFRVTAELRGAAHD